MNESSGIKLCVRQLCVMLERMSEDFANFRGPQNAFVCVCVIVFGTEEPLPLNFQSDMYMTMETH